ncbi:MAG: prepilin-type N-terminal cleavage/methylation domain-containing protein [Verrucomicrobiales bacterium]|nr:prepilin-type N-terminal cleavage/methylation domain-containing protein [Verrucomicrobiales bacterium]
MKRIRVLRHDGLTLVEVLVVLAILAVLAGLVVPALTSPRTRSDRIVCVNHLKNIGLGMRIFANDMVESFRWIFLRAGAEPGNSLGTPTASGNSFSFSPTN